MLRLYRALLEWVVEDQAVGLQIKTKKKQVLEDLPAVQPLLDEAVETGRCLGHRVEISYIPASTACVDMAVGIGISASVV